MADSDKILKLLIELGVVGREDAEAAAKILEETKEGTRDLAKEMGVLTVSSEEAERILKQTGAATEDAGEKTEEAGDKASHSRGKHMALRRIMGELNRISPGLGEAMHLVSEAYLEAGAAAEGGAVGVTGFTAALDELLLTLGPLIIAMLGIEAVMKYWEMYKDHVEEAAKVQEEAMKRIVDSTHEALKAVKELDEAMHPKKHNLAEQDEEYLKQQEQAMENAANRRKDLNKAAEEKELAGAATKEDKQKIKEKYEVLDKQLEDWRAKQKAAIEGAVAQGMESQLKHLKEEEDKLVKKTHAEYQYGIETGDMTRYNKTKDELAKNAEEAKAIREKLDELNGKARDDSSQAVYNSETNREVFRTKGINYKAPDVQDRPPGPDFDQRKQIDALLPKVVGAEYSHFEGGKAFDQTQAATIAALQCLLEKNHQNSKLILEIIVTGIRKHESLESIIAAVQSQMNNTRSQYGTG